MLVRPVYQINYAFIFPFNMNRSKPFIHFYPLFDKGMMSVSIVNILSLVVLSVPQTETLQVKEISGELRQCLSGRPHGKQRQRTSWLSGAAL